MISEVTYRSVARTSATQFWETIVEHFNPHQFGVVICDRCETLVHGVRMVLDLHPN
jgi:hypothetical protein